MINAVSVEHSKEILAKLLEAVGAPADFDFSQPNWFHEYEWTNEEQEEFIKWLGAFLVKHKYAFKGKKRGRNAGEYEASKMMMNYGWKTKSSH